MPFIGPINTQIRFPVGAHVRHLPTGKLYEILHGPECARLEKENVPCYIYRRVKDPNVRKEELDILWVRAAAIMEKRFVVVE